MRYGRDALVILVTSLPGWLNHPFRVGFSQGRGWPPTKLFPLEPLFETGPTGLLLYCQQVSSHPTRSRQLGSCRHFPSSRTANSQALVVFLKPSPILQASTLIVPAPIYLLSVPHSPRHTVIAVIPVNASARNRFGIIGPA